ncbi:glycosyl hydrolase family 18 protein [Sphingomonas sp. LB-2]|uniref:jacalin-like lectin n=1 Tax=Sphingomonas caeni TaxID=2984949 RepID=UPI0022302F25|nr:glycosyl hydrolase family 18 protein [Sphingomonas caeni]MCW3849027.1 glycosyl hydrolase family 18 protein [Sphingomonas caeni]
MAIPTPSVGAWILPSEEDPANTPYDYPGGSYQSLIVNGVYKSVDILNICFVDTVSTPNGYSIALGECTHTGGVTNLQYMQWIIADARAANPGIKILVTMGYAADEISQLFSGPSSGWPAVLAQYAQNIVTYLQTYDLDGLDVDWEWPFSDSTTQSQFQQAFTAIGNAFAGTPYILSMCPNETSNLDPATVNTYFDIVTLQLYGAADRGQFIRYGINANLLGYGAKFESVNSDDLAPYQDAQQAYAGYQAGPYDKLTQWRLNSGDFQFEQAQQMILYQLIKGSPTGPFDDTHIAAAAGNPPITSLAIRSGNVLDAIQATSSSSFEGNPVTYTTVQHGGNGGNPTPVTLATGDTITSISGYTGTWYGWQVVLQITVHTAKGASYGPFGSMAGSTSQTPFTLSAPAGQSIVAFSGSVETVPMAGGGEGNVVASLGVTCA